MRAVYWTRCTSIDNDDMLRRKRAKKGFIDEEHVSDVKDIENLRV